MCKKSVDERINLSNLELKTPINILVIELIRCWRVVRMATGDNLGGTKTSKVITTRAQVAQNIGSDPTRTKVALNLCLDLTRTKVAQNLDLELTKTKVAQNLGLDLTRAKVA